MYEALGRLADILARLLAYAGGIVLLVLVALTCVSIAGRAFVPLDIGIGPIRGIYDYTEIGMAAAIFAFLPWAQLQDAHAKVDLFQAAMPEGVNRLLDLIFNIGMTVIAVYGTWRLYLGMVDKRRFGDITPIAELPLWLGYAACLAGGAGFILVAAFCVLRSARRLAGRPE